MADDDDIAGSGVKGKQLSLIAESNPQSDSRIVRKNNNEIGYRIKSGHLSLIARKMFNILIWYAQDMRGKEDADGRWCVPVASLIKDARFNSNNYDLLRSCLDELQEVRVIRPRFSGGLTSEVLIPSYTLDNVSHSANELSASGEKKRGGFLMLWFMLPPELKSQLLNPEQYTRLPIAYMVMIRTVPGFNLYEICRRYVSNPGKITHRASWQDWWRILTGSTEDAEPPDYKYAKRDVFKRAIDDVNAVSDIEVGLIEFKAGKFVQDIQFSVNLKRQSNLNIEPPPIDSTLLAKVTGLGITAQEAERLVAKHSEKEILETLALIAARAAKSHLPALNSPAAFFKRALKDGYAKSAAIATEANKKQTAEKRAIEQKQETAEAESRQAAQRKRDQAAVLYEAMDEEGKLALLTAFETTLAKSNKAIFAKSGINNKMLRETFIAWLVKHPLFAN